MQTGRFSGIYFLPPRKEPQTDDASRLDCRRRAYLQLKGSIDLKGYPFAPQKLRMTALTE